MYVPSVQLHEAGTLDEAAALLSEYPGDARLLAGGTDLLVDLKTGRVAYAHLVSINSIGALRGVRVGEDGLRIGALTTVTELDRAPELDGAFTPLRDATSRMAAPQVRNAATVGGNVAGAVPCADLPPILMVMNASAVIWSPEGERVVPLGEVYRGPRETILQPGEILTTIVVPPPPQRFGAAYARFALRNGNAIAVAGVAVGLELDDANVVREARITLASVAPIPKPAKSAAELLIGRALDDDAVEAAAAAAMEAAEPISDVRGSAEYRREVVGVLTRRALAEAAARAGGEA